MIPRFRPNLGLSEFTTLFKPNKGAVERFEDDFASRFEAVDALAFPYGRSALWAFLQAVGVEDSEVIIPAYTCSVVAHAVKLSGNKPRFVDIRLSDLNMDLDQLASKMNENTRAVVATHLFGYPLDLERVEKIIADAESKYGHKIWLIQDCAHSFGAEWHGRHVGTSGDVALYALNISKMITSIFGGMLTFQDPKLALKVRAWRDSKFRKGSWQKGIKRRAYLLATFIAFHESMYRLTWWLQENTKFLDRFSKYYHRDDKVHFPQDYLDLMLDTEAAVGLVQLQRYAEIISNRRATAAYFDLHLKRHKGWFYPPLVEGATYSHYVVRVPNRDDVRAKLAKQGVEVGELIQYSVPQLNSYKDTDDETPNSNMVSQLTINVPIVLSDPCDQRDQILHAFSAITTGDIANSQARPERGESVIRDATESDISGIIAIHSNSLPKDVFPNMGLRFLRKYYRSLLLNKSGHVLVAVQQGVVLGFVSIELDRINLIRLFSLRDLGVFLLNATLRPGLIVSAVYQMLKNKDSYNNRISEISFIAVAADQRRQGICKKLILSAMRKSKDVNKTHIKTKTSNVDLSDYYQHTHKAIISDKYKIFGTTYKTLKWQLSA